MSISPHSGEFSRSPYFNTLQITSESSKNDSEIGFELQKEIEEFNRDGWVGDTLKKRAKSKFLNTVLMDRMTQIRSPLHEKYEATYFCSHQITVEGNKAKSNFCMNRFCIICNRIRTAQLVITYMPTLDTWAEKSFLTLTVKNIEAEKLKPTLQKMYKNFTKIKDLERKQGCKLVGVRKLECTYNREANEYHPHYHLILENSERCERIINRWLDLFPDANIKGQDFRNADKDSCFELFKYFTKLSSNSSKDNTITVSALDNILNSIVGIRTFQPFGFVAHKLEPPPENIDLSQEIEPKEMISYNYDKKYGDWLDKESGELLTNYNSKDNENFKYRIR